MHSHHEKAPFVCAALLIVITILTGIGTFTDYWGTMTTGGTTFAHTGLYHWGKSDGNNVFQKQPSWWKCVVVCQLMAFSFELLFLILVIPAMIFRKHMPVHAVCSFLSFVIFILLTISVIVFGVNVDDYQKFGVKLRVGWSWGISLAADILAFFLLLVNGTSTGFSAYQTYR
ncbi:unnamed protein product [Caenorhabditis bovis]|uniref:Uncharacterized protein n=1 Tax=Caenorhabditis bovis TaxID=2654633 RepID=A0A8S1E6D6_9PELO|nr:unnamed protein product [Caenorhabditis bovis]